VNGRFEFWIEADKVKTANYQVGEEILFRTQGNSIFLATIQRTGTPLQRLITSLFKLA
jgi:hypothetical protein